MPFLNVDLPGWCFTRSRPGRREQRGCFLGPIRDAGILGSPPGTMGNEKESHAGEGNTQGGRGCGQGEGAGRGPARPGTGWLAALTGQRGWFQGRQVAPSSKRLCRLSHRAFSSPCVTATDGGGCVRGGAWSRPRTPGEATGQGPQKRQGSPGPQPKVRGRSALLEGPGAPA